MPNPYDVLGLTPEAEVDDIRAAYRRRAAQVHPDLQPTEKKEWAAEQMRQLNAARDLLLDPRRRAALDARTATFRRGPRPEADRPRRWQTAEPRFYTYADVYTDLARDRRRAREFRRLIVLGAFFAVLFLTCALSIAAPGLLVAIAQLATTVLTLALSVVLPVVVAALIGFVFFSLRDL